MAYRATPTLNFPIGNFKNISSRFLERNFYDGKDWGVHLGVDFASRAETKVFAIGRGTVVYSKLHAGIFSEDGKIAQRNWGGITIIAHKNPKTKEKFYSLYGHLGRRFVKKGDYVEMGDVIGTVGKSMSESNGIWEDEHLHFAIYAGPFHLKVLPGYYRADEETARIEHWKEPMDFINNYLKKTAL
jgi:murein DD-endopeptidase MepM/ murein hydrolase activator NlpD